MKILITGGNGQLGTEIKKCFEHGFTSIGVPKILKEENYVDAIDLDTLDITDTKSVKAFFAGSQYELIINCAAYTNVNKCEIDRINAFKVNAVGARNLAIVADQIDAKLIHVSTDYVFSGEASKPYNEWDLCNPQNIYGASKYLGETYVKQFCKKYFIVRTAWLYSYYGNNFVKTCLLYTSEAETVS